MSPLPGSSAGPPQREMPVPWAFFHVSIWIPSKGAPLPGFPNRALAERDATFLEPSFNYFSKFPVSGPPHQVPQQGRYGERHLFPDPPSTHTLITHLSLKVPGKGAPSTFPSRVHMERDAPSPEPMVNSFIYVCQSPQWRSPPTKWGRTYSHCLWSPNQMEGLLTMGCGLVPQGDCLWHCNHYPSAMQPSARYLPPWLG
jgi:hypothetical protein